MLADILIAAVLVAIAVILGLTVHPVLWFIIILAILMLVWHPVNRGGYGRRGL